MRDYLLTGAKIVSKDHVIEGSIAVENGLIVALGDIDKGYSHLPKIEYHASDIVFPGFIDTHIHGCMGVDVMDGEVDALKVISHHLLKQGVTGFLATTMTQTDELISNAMRAIKQFSLQAQGAGDCAKLLGVHLEGPFISPHKIGAQNPNYLQGCSLEKLQRWHDLSGQQIKKVTLAPEIKGSEHVINWCVENGAIGSIGHTNCSVNKAKEAIDLGCIHATHLYNAMSGVDHRQPGAAVAVLMSKKVAAELIVDGVHLSPEIVKMTYQIKGADGIVLVTDAMSAQGYGEGVFDLGGQKVIVKNNEARLENGVLAGSVLTMNKALKNMLQYTDAPLPELVKMTSFNAAKGLNAAKKVGNISVGLQANLLVLDKNIQIKAAYTSS